MAARSSALVASWERHTLQHWGWEKISLSVCWPGSVIASDFIRSIEPHSHQCDSYPCLFQRIQIGFRYLLVSNHFMHGRYRHDVTQAATAELTGIANRNRPVGDFNHSPVDFTLQ